MRVRAIDYTPLVGIAFSHVLFLRCGSRTAIFSGAASRLAGCAESSLPSGAALLPRFISEPDRGVYDAMNKGIKLAQGEIVGILNADDFYAGPDVLARVAKVFEVPAVGACYGDLCYVKEDTGRRAQTDPQISQIGAD